jgi:hypothetical protein
MPDRKPSNASDAFIGNPGVLAKEIGFGEDSVKDNAFGAGNLVVSLNARDGFTLF